MTRRRAHVGRAAPVLMVTGVVLAGCGGAPYGPGSSSVTSESGSVDVNTPELRAQKASTEIPPCPPSDGAPAASGGLPDVTLPCLGGGRSVALAQLTGTPLVINLWGQYCGPCRAETPVLQQVHEEVGERVRFLGVDYDDTQPDAALAFASELGVTYPLVADPDAVIRTSLLQDGVPIQGVPITLFVDSSGEISYVSQGAIQSAAELRTLIHRYLGVSVPESQAS